MQKVIKGKSRGLAKLVDAALVAARKAKLYGDEYTAARSTAVAAIKAEYPELQRGDTLVFDGGRVEGADEIKRKLDLEAFEKVAVGKTIGELLALGYIKLDLATIEEKLPKLVEVERVPGTPKFVASKEEVKAAKAA